MFVPSEENTCANVKCTLCSSAIIDLPTQAVLWLLMLIIDSLSELSNSNDKCILVHYAKNIPYMYESTVANCSNIFKWSGGGD